MRERLSSGFPPTRPAKSSHTLLTPYSCLVGLAMAIRTCHPQLRINMLSEAVVPDRLAKLAMAQCNRKIWLRGHGEAHDRSAADGDVMRCDPHSPAESWPSAAGHYREPAVVYFSLITMLHHRRVSWGNPSSCPTLGRHRGCRLGARMLVPD